jgi:cell division initiation protein
MLNEAKVKVRNTIEDAEMKSKQTLVEMEDRLKSMVENYKKLESTRDELLLELKRISQDTIERVERIKNSQRSFDADQHVTQARKDIKKTIFPNVEFNPTPELVELPTLGVNETEEELVVAKSLMAELNSHKATKSFFDEIR